ncbi:hypothetical protein [Halonatronum saccharophilum]|uniref:hypothetical protein n=1 Tax=Halonatronum saccharophilum TaxID=150060 RepID=UPI0004813B8C|nr:hypothetical protein [Halonatronum saccharophilum]
MPEVKINPKKRDEALTDIIEATALERAALAELINAGAEEMREVMRLEDINMDKLIEFQGSLKGIIDSGIEIRKIVKDDINTNSSESSLESEEVIEVEEEIIEDVTDGKKRITKVIRKKKKD